MPSLYGECIMKMVKIKFQNPGEDAQGALELEKHFIVVCLLQDTYKVLAQASNYAELHFAY